MSSIGHAIYDKTRNRLEVVRSGGALRKIIFVIKINIIYIT